MCPPRCQPAGSGLCRVFGVTYSRPERTRRACQFHPAARWDSRTVVMVTRDPDLYLAVSGFIVCALTFHLKAGSVALTSVFFISCLSLSHFLFCFLFRLEGSSGFGRQRKVRQVFSDRLPARVLFNVLLFVCRGDTALHKAASEKLHAVCRLLVEAGASLKKTNFRVFTVNHLTHKRFPESPAGCLR